MFDDSEVDEVEPRERKEPDGRIMTILHHVIGTETSSKCNHTATVSVQHVFVFNQLTDLVDYMLVQQKILFWNINNWTFYYASNTTEFIEKNHTDVIFIRCCQSNKSRIYKLEK